MNYEDLLEQLGGFGRYQIMMIFLLSYVAFQNGFEYQNLAVAIYEQPFQCAIPTMNSTLRDQCITSNGTCTQWLYSRNTMQETLVTEYNLVCQNLYWKNFIVNAHFFGRSFSSIGGLLSDFFGRSPIIRFSLMIKLLAVWFLPFISSLEGQLVIRVFEGFGSLLMSVCLVLAVEIVPVKYRPWVTTSVYTPWTLGYMFSSLVNYYGCTWRRVYFIAALTSLIHVPLLFLKPESPRWLLVKDKVKEARQMLHRISWFNGKSKNAEAIELNAEIPNTDGTESFYLYFTMPNLRIRLLLLAFGFWTHYMCYYGVTMNLNFATENIFINIALMGLIEMPTGPLSAVMVQRCGRKWTYFSCAGITAICILSVPFLPLEGALAMIRTLFALSGKFTLTMSCFVADVWCIELLPTSLRSAGVAFVMFWANVGLLIAPYIEGLNVYFKALSALIYSGQLVICVITFVFLFPETSGLPLPEKADEANSLYVGKEKEWKNQILLNAMPSCTAETKKEEDV